MLHATFLTCIFAIIYVHVRMRACIGIAFMLHDTFSTYYPIFAIIYVHVRTHACVCVHKFQRNYPYTYTYTYTHIYMYIFRYIHST